MKKMPAFFSWVPGRCREATEEGKKSLSAPLDEIRPADERPHPYPFLATRAVPVPQAGEGILFVFSAIFAIVEMADTYASLWQAAQFCPAQMFHKKRRTVVRREDWEGFIN